MQDLEELYKLKIQLHRNNVEKITELISKVNEKKSWELYRSFDQQLKHVAL